MNGRDFLSMLGCVSMLLLSGNISAAKTRAKNLQIQKGDVNHQYTKLVYNRFSKMRTKKQRVLQQQAQTFKKHIESGEAVNKKEFVDFLAASNKALWQEAAAKKADEQKKKSAGIQKPRCCNISGRAPILIARVAPEVVVAELVIDVSD